MAHRNRVTVSCKHCGKDFEIVNSRIEGNRGKYCSAQCYHNSQKNNIGESNTNWRGGKIRRICLMCGNIYYKKQCQADSIVCSAKCGHAYKSKYLVGEKSACWKGGITPINKKIRASDEFVNWRNAVYAKYGYACAKCGDKEKIHAHHIIPFCVDESLRFDISNGITLCKRCHINEHIRLRKIRGNQNDIFIY